VVAGRAMSKRAPLSLVLALALAACEQGQPPAPPPSPAETRTAPSAPTVAAQPTTASANPAAKPGLALPERFTALGTEPFWAAEVDGERLTYKTPEDQVGQVAAITRTPGDGVVTLEGALARQALTLTISAGPCSDGMSDTVYPFSVTRRLGDDTQRGCARPR